MKTRIAPYITVKNLRAVRDRTQVCNEEELENWLTNLFKTSMINYPGPVPEWWHVPADQARKFLKKHSNQHVIELLRTITVRHIP